MCVAVYKPAGVQAPSMDILWKCWDHNPDGAGIGYTTHGNKFAIRKGFMKWESFEKAITKLGDLTKAQVFFHFRIATHGSVRPGNCHPFPISDKLSDLQAQHGVYDRVLMHNGVLPITPLLKDTSDSQELARRLSKFTSSEDLFDDAMELLDGFESTSKIAIWDRGYVRMLGSWTEKNGVYYSNTNWEWSYRYPSSYGSGGCAGGRVSYLGCGGWDDYDDTGYCGYNNYRSKWDKSYAGGSSCGALTTSGGVSSNQGVASSTAKPTKALATGVDHEMLLHQHLCPSCRNVILAEDFTKNSAYCDYCDIEWIGDFAKAFVISDGGKD